MRYHVSTAMLLASSLLAQTPTHISPAAAATGLGNSNNNIPLSWTPSAYQQVHSVSSFNNSSPGVWTSLNMRMGSGFGNGVYGGQSIDVEMYLAESPNDATTAVSTFASNVSPGTEINVFPRRMILLPIVPNNNWVVTFPFTTPFVYTGAAHISWRVIQHGNSAGNQIFTYPLDAWWNIGSNTANGASSGCRANTGTQAATHNATVWSPGVTSTFTGNSYVVAGGLPAVLTIGFDGSNWNGIPLPFDLTPAGAPGCFIGNSIADLVVGTTNANSNGSVSLTYFIPPDPSLQGGVFFTQYLFVDFAANSLGVFTSNSLRNTIGTNHNVCRIYAAGNPSAVGGTLGRQFGMSLGFN